MTTKSVETTVNHLSTLLRDKFGIQDLQDRLIFTSTVNKQIKQIKQAIIDDVFYGIDDNSF